MLLEIFADMQRKVAANLGRPVADGKLLPSGLRIGLVLSLHQYDK
jgi:hypothetical protein